MYDDFDDFREPNSDEVASIVQNMLERHTSAVIAEYVRQAPLELQRRLSLLEKQVNALKGLVVP